MFYSGNWIHSFPEQYQWSNATLVTKGMAPYGAVALGEIDWVVQRLHARIKEPQAWWEEWTAEAERVERAGDAAAAEGRHATAGNYYLRAGNYYYTGERMVPPGEQKLGIYRKALRCYQEGLKRRNPNLEIVDVPYDGTALPAYFLKSPVAKGRAPTVVLFDGLDNCKEMSVLFAGIELAFRGFHTLAIDGPGQGEALRLRRLPSRYDYEVPGTAAYEYVAARADVDPKRVAIMAYSAGGYYAPRAAAFEPRYAACVAWGPHFDYHAVWETALGGDEEGRQQRRLVAFPAAVGARRRGHGNGDGEAEEVHARRRRGAHPVPDADLLGHAGQADAALGRRPALRRGRLARQDAEDLRRGRRRRGALPGGQPAGRYGLHRRLAIRASALRQSDPKDEASQEKRPKECVTDNASQMKRLRRNARRRRAAGSQHRTP